MTRIRRGLTRLGLVAGASVCIATCTGFGSSLEPKFGPIEWLAGFTGAGPESLAGDFLLGAISGGMVLLLFAGVAWALEGFAKGAATRDASPKKQQPDQPDNASDQGPRE